MQIIMKPFDGWQLWHLELGCIYSLNLFRKSDFLRKREYYPLWFNNLFNWIFLKDIMQRAYSYTLNSLKTTVGHSVISAGELDPIKSVPSVSIKRGAGSSDWQLQQHDDIVDADGGNMRDLFIRVRHWRNPPLWPCSLIKCAICMVAHLTPTFSALISCGYDGPRALMCKLTESRLICSCCLCGALLDYELQGGAWHWVSAMGVSEVNINKP